MLPPGIKGLIIIAKLSVLGKSWIHLWFLSGYLWNTFLKQSQIYVAAWLFPVGKDLFESPTTSEKRFVECLLPSVIMLSLNN